MNIKEKWFPFFIPILLFLSDSNYSCLIGPAEAPERGRASESDRASTVMHVEKLVHVSG